MTMVWTRIARPAALGAAAALAVTGCGGVDVTMRSTDPVAVQIPSCHAADLIAGVGEFGSVMSQPFLTVKLTNHTSSACTLRGYPALSIVGSFDQPPSRPVHVAVTHGSTYERADPGPHTIVVAPHRFASFTIGTGTAYTGPLATLHRFEIRLTTGDDALVVSQEMPANGPRGEPIPVKETALGLGMPPR